MIAGIPGMLLLQRFSPLGVRDPVFTVEPPRDRRPMSAAAVALRGAGGGIIGLLAGALCMATLSALKAMRADPAAPFDLAGQLVALTTPHDAGSWLEAAGLLVFTAFVGLCTAAVFAARHAGNAMPGPEAAGSQLST